MNDMRALERALIERYNKRLEKFGDDPRTLGWDTRQNQARRFRALLDLASPRGKSMLDIGCGFADLLCAAKESGRAPASYLGVDINPALLEIAKRRHPQAAFEVRNLFDSPFQKPVCDIGYMCGVLNFKLSGFSNVDFAKTMIRNAFAACREALVVDMLSARRDEAYPAEDFVHYYEPAEMISFALELTPHATVKHDYASLPQREMALLLRRRPEP